MPELKSIIEAAYEERSTLTPKTVASHVKDAIYSAIDLLNTGKGRVAEKIGSEWQINQWLRKAVLLYFRIHDCGVMEGGGTQYFDKIPLKFPVGSEAELQTAGVRIVPGTIVRTGTYIAPNTVLMPCFVNIGAYIDSGTMVDTWATVGSCVQVGKNVHLSGGVGLGGVLEPLQANPTIIEDNCFLGARSEIVEGVIVEEGSVISMGVYIGQSTRIYNRLTDEITYGRVPAGSVVVPGNLPSKDGKYSLYCAVIVKQVDAKTRAKVSINDLLRNIDESSSITN